MVLQGGTCEVFEKRSDTVLFLVGVNRATMPHLSLITSITSCARKGNLVVILARGSET
jgi:hypothetical protein